MASPPPGFLAPTSDHGYDIGGNLTSALVIGAAAILCTFALVVFYFVRYICIGRQLQHADFSSGSCNGGNENKALVLKELPVVSWNELLGKKKMKGDEACSVCLGDFGDLESDGTSDTKLRLLPRCGHCFHSQCVDGWLNEHSLCPVCRGRWLPLDLKAAAALLSGSLDSDSVGNSGGLSSVVNPSGVSSDRAEALEGQNGQGGGGGGGVIDLESGGRGLSLVEGNGAEGSK